MKARVHNNLHHFACNMPPLEIILCYDHIYRLIAFYIIVKYFAKLTKISLVTGIFPDTG